jgi:hypothetical protein
MRLAADQRVCLQCGGDIREQRADAVVCSDICRIRLYRSDEAVMFRKAKSASELEAIVRRGERKPGLLGDVTAKRHTNAEIVAVIEPRDLLMTVNRTTPQECTNRHHGGLSPEQARCAALEQENAELREANASTPAGTASTTVKICSIEGCEKTSRKRGMCGQHYDRWRRTRTDGKACSIEGCTKPAESRGWCKAHYLTWRRHGDPCFRKPEGQACSMDGCERPATRRGLCEMHYSRLRRHGDPQHTAKRDAQIMHERPGEDNLDELLF